MLKNSLHIIFLLLASLTTQGQEYFSSVHIEEDYPETTSNVVVLEDGYATIGSVNEEGTRYINIRKFNIYGELVDVIKHQLEGIPLFGFAESFKQTNDGGYIWVGTDGVISTYRFNADFELLWSKKYDTLYPEQFGFLNQSYEYENGDFLIVGRLVYEIDDGHTEDILLIKIDSEGNVIWHKTHGLENSNDWLVDILPMDDGGFILVGAKYFPWDAYIVKIDSEGNKEWHKSYGGDYWDYLARGVKTQDGNIVIAFEDAKEYVLEGGIVEPNDSYNYATIHLIKIDPDGNTIWDKEHAWIRIAYGAKLIETDNGDLVFLGRQSYPIETQVGRSSFVLKTNSEGDSLWFRHYSHSGFPELTTSEAYDIEQTDYGFVMSGIFIPYELSTDYTQAQHTWIMHMDDNGCVNTTCEYLDTEERISIEDDFSIYPNPANDKIFINIPEKNLDQKINISFYSITGQLIEERSLESLEMTLEVNTTFFPKGIYIVKITAENNTVTSSELLSIQ